MSIQWLHFLFRVSFTLLEAVFEHRWQMKPSFHFMIERDPTIGLVGMGTLQEFDEFLAEGHNRFFFLQTKETKRHIYDFF
jgi:hypothetical protein